MRKKADIAENVKKFLDNETVSGGLAGGAIGTGLGLMNTEPELSKLMPYLTGGTLSGALIGSGMPTDSEIRERTSESSSPWPTVLGVLGAIGGGIGGAKVAPGTAKALGDLGWQRAGDLAKNKQALTKLIGALAGGGAGYGVGSTTSKYDIL